LSMDETILNVLLSQGVDLPTAVAAASADPPRADKRRTNAIVWVLVAALIAPLLLWLSVQLR
jgi:hypothetical protein